MCIDVEIRWKKAKFGYACLEGRYLSIFFFKHRSYSARNETMHWAKKQKLKKNFAPKMILYYFKYFKNPSQRLKITLNPLHSHPKSTKQLGIFFILKYSSYLSILFFFPPVTEIGN